MAKPYPTATTSAITGAVNGVAVKFSNPEPCPSTNIHVRIPMVDPSVSALITAALIGSTTDPKARNISSVVAVSKMTSIAGMLSNRLWMESCSSAGVPPTYTSSPLGGVIARSSCSFLAASPGLISPFCSTRTEGSFDAPGATLRSCHMFAGSLSGSMNPLIDIALLRMSATCWSVTGWWLVDWITRVSGLVRYPGKSWSKCSWDWRTELLGGRYFSLMPPSDRLNNGMTSKIIPRTIGMAKTSGRRITQLTSLPQKPASTSSRVLVFCSRSASQFR
ncbi:hypothetical protein LAUMK7_00627 [Mycobacterium kansasii]|nr:hypothetical protein LAUMK22_00002 [Mycobacterium kansasii]VAZ64610.1 hypothetical protein LAUMK40_00728 [Mycobacterium kansasii]VAZ71064.1 hypothetical protein LAUMK7_00627 [Mycobacterium kansasii]